MDDNLDRDKIFFNASVLRPFVAIDQCDRSDGAWQFARSDQPRYHATVVQWAGFERSRTVDGLA